MCRSWVILKALVAVLGLLCVLLVIGIAVLLTGNTSCSTPPPQNGAYGNQDYHDMQNKKLCFPKHSDDSFVKILLDYKEPLTHLTLCMRYFTQFSRKEQSLFSMATRSYSNAFLLFIERNGKFSFEVNHDSIWTNIASPPGQWNSVCASWNVCGTTEMWLNGKKFSLQRISTGRGIDTQAIIKIGQEQDSYGGSLDITQCFVGEISDVYLWGHGKTTTLVSQFLQTQRSSFDDSFLINWRAFNYTSLSGHASVISNSSVCDVD
ncbi:mucosal pentraxin-like isoform X2 [Engraulis encrasicolus]|uniref:mucosal pentraxin-like isoform X2 n=1 Tax=Engraulis encrasicolus TaxID=184585 RepID=UPI002FCF4A37